MNSLVLGNFSEQIKAMAPLTILNKFFKKEGGSTYA